MDTSANIVWVLLVFYVHSVCYPNHMPPVVFLLRSQDFLNGVCTHIIWLTQNKLNYYTGNYDTFIKTVQENEVVQMKQYQKQQDDIKHIKEFIASCGKWQ